MVLQSRERKYIVKIGILIAVFLVAPNYVINSSDEFRRTESLRQNRLAQELASYVDRLARIEDERDLFRRFSDSYERLLDRGILNTPDRRSLLETASEIGRDRSFFEIGYRFDEPTEIVADQNRITEGSTIRVRIDRLAMQMEMLHDLDTFIFLEDYQSRINEKLVPTFCRFERKTPGFQVVNRPNFSSECNIDRISIIDPEVAKSEDERQQDVQASLTPPPLAPISAPEKVSIFGVLNGWLVGASRDDDGGE